MMVIIIANACMTHHLLAIWHNVWTNISYKPCIINNSKTTYTKHAISAMCLYIYIYTLYYFANLIDNWPSFDMYIYNVHFVSCLLIYILYFVHVIPNSQFYIDSMSNNLGYHNYT